MNIKLPITNFKAITSLPENNNDPAFGNPGLSSAFRRFYSDDIRLEVLVIRFSKLNACVYHFQQLSH